MGRVWYVCNWSGESGGIKTLYDHVLLLRHRGVDARLGAYGEFERCTWFESSPDTTPGVSCFLNVLRGDDLVVLPDIAMWDTELASARCRKLVFVQNPDLMTGSANGGRYEAVLVPSRPLVAWLREEKRYSGPIYVVPGLLEPELIDATRSDHPGEPRYLIIRRLDKSRDEPERCYEALRRARCEVALVQSRMPRSRFLDLFRMHDVYLHSSYREGFPVSVLEAFALGCLVVGFSGRGGDEFMRHDDNCLVVPDGAWDRAVAAALEVRTWPPERQDQMRRRARETAAQYPPERTGRALAAVLEKLAGDAP